MHGDITVLASKADYFSFAKIWLRELCDEANDVKWHVHAYRIMFVSWMKGE